MRNRMLQSQLVSPERDLLTGDPAAITVISPQGSTDIAHLDPDLMTPAGFKPDGTERSPLTAVDAVTVQDGQLRAFFIGGADHDLISDFILDEIIREGELVLHIAPDHAEVFAAHFVDLELGGETGCRLAGAGEDQQPAKDNALPDPKPEQEAGQPPLPSPDDIPDLPESNVPM